MNESIIKAFEDREGEECSRVIVPQPDVLHIELLRNLPDGIYGLVISFVSNKFHKIFIVKKKEGADEYLGEVQLDEVRAIIINKKKKHFPGRFHKFLLRINKQFKK